MKSTSHIRAQGKEIALRQQYAIASKQVERVFWPSKHKAPGGDIAHAYVAMAQNAAPGNPHGWSMVSRLMMPVGFLASTFNFSLKWDGKKRRVEITTTK